MRRFDPIYIAQWPILGEGAGPVHVGWDHAMTSKSRIYKSLKNYFPFHPPKISILLPPITFALWLYLAVGEPLPSGPWYQVKVNGSKACKSL